MQRLRLPLAAALLGAAAVAQNPGTSGTDVETLRRSLDEVRAAQERLAAENRALRDEVTTLKAAQASGDAAAAEARVDQEINALAGRMAGLEVKSGASALTITGEFRFRTVTAFANAGAIELDGYWTDARVRTGFKYDFAKDVSAFTEFQSHWAFGSGASTNNSFGSPFALTSTYAVGSGDVTTDVDLYQAYAELRNVFNCSNLKYRVGRQEIVLGNQFQFGNADWYSGWSFDGMRLDYDSDSFALTAFTFKGATGDRDINQFHSVAGAHDDDEMYGLYATYKGTKNLTLDGYWFYMNGHGGANAGAPFGGSGTTIGSLGNSVGGGGLAAGSTAYFHTLGARVAGKFEGVADGLDYNLEAAFQTGDVHGAGAITDVSGFAFEGEVGLMFDAAHLFRLYARFLWSEGPSGDESGYVMLYPNRHGQGNFLARYGTLDVMPMSNVITPQVGVTYAPNADWILGAQVMWATADEGAVLGGANDDYGFEADLWALHKVSENFTLVGALIFLFPDDEGTALFLVDDDVAVAVAFQARLSF
jgi:hypothetical protein